jgi:hypothetical protein
MQKKVMAQIKPRGKSKASLGEKEDKTCEPVDHGRFFSLSLAIFLSFLPAVPTIFRFATHFA